MTAALQPAEPAHRVRHGGRAGKRAGGAAAFEQPPFRQLKNPLTPTRLVSDDELESIHLASLRVLKEIGVEVLHEEARAIMKRHGADVRDGSERVRFDSDMILELMASCPSEFTLHARNPAHNVRFGGNNLIFSQMGSAPNCSDMDGGRRPGNRADFRNFLKLAQMHNILQTTGGVPLVKVTSGQLSGSIDLRFENNCYFSSGAAWKVLWGATTYTSIGGFRGSGQEKFNGANVGTSTDPLLTAPGAGGTFVRNPSWSRASTFFGSARRTSFSASRASPSRPASR